MPRYYCDYCDTYLTHDSPSVRKQHNAGYKHKANVRTYYQQFEEQQTQSYIDQKIKEHLGSTVVYHQVGAAYSQHIATFPGNPQRPRLPILPLPVFPIPGSGPIPGIRPPILSRPGAPGYGVPPVMAPIAGQPLVPGQPPVASSLSLQINGLPRPPTLGAPATVPGGQTAPSSNGPPVAQSLYESNPSGAAAPSASTGTDGYSFAQVSEAGH